jgi:hypothetical protein
MMVLGNHHHFINGMDGTGADAPQAEVTENADEDAEAEDEADAVEQALTETAKAPPRAASRKKRKSSSGKVRGCLYCRTLRNCALPSISGCQAILQ